MPRGCRWLYVGKYFRDDSCSQRWTMYVAKDGTGNFYVRIDGEEIQTGSIGSVESLVGFFADYGDEYLSHLRQAVRGVRGFKEVCRMIDFRLGEIGQI